MTRLIRAQKPKFLGNVVWTSKSATPNIGDTQFMTDVGVNGTMMRWNGTLWAPISGAILLFSTNVPIIKAPSGSMANNGAVTFGTALPLAYTGAYVYFPANAIFAGSTAGFYWTECSSTTVATVYNNTYTPGSAVARPTSKTAFVTTGPGAFTGSTSEITAHSCTLPANLLGPKGVTLLQFNHGGSATAGSKDIRVRWNTSNVMFQVNVTSTPFTTYPRVVIGNRDSVSSQYCANWNQAVTGTNPGTERSVDTSAAVTVTVSFQTAVATDHQVFENVLFEVYPQ